VVQDFLKNGADVHATDPFTGETLLQLAQNNKQERIANLLKKHIGASKKKKKK